jgi:hypothetical protein
MSTIPQPGPHGDYGPAGPAALAMNGIGWAVKQMQDGQKVQRAGWNGKGMWLCLVKEWNGNFGRSLSPNWSVLPFVAMRTAGAEDGMVPWLCSQTDLLATDWVLA